MTRRFRLLRYFVFAAGMMLPATSTPLPWDKDMVDQPAIKPQETLVEPVASTSVQVSGREAYPVPTSGRELVMTRLRAGRELQNPIAVSEASLELGKQAYTIQCASCHGDSGKGEGSVGQKYLPPPMDLTTLYVQNQADGQIFYTITHGSLIMPFYREALSADERWHVVNYVKRGLVKP